MKVETYYNPKEGGFPHCHVGTYLIEKKEIRILFGDKNPCSFCKLGVVAHELLHHFLYSVIPSLRVANKINWYFDTLSDFKFKYRIRKEARYYHSRGYF